MANVIDIMLFLGTLPLMYINTDERSWFEYHTRQKAYFSTLFSGSFTVAFNARTWLWLHNWLSTTQAELVSTYLLSGSLDDLARCHIGLCFSSTQDSRRLQCRISKLEMGFPTILTFVQVWDKKRGFILHQDYSPAKSTHKMQWTLRSLHYDLSMEKDIFKIFKS